MTVCKDFVYSRPEQQHLHYFVWAVVGDIWDHRVNLKVSIDILKTVREDIFWSGTRRLLRISACLSDACLAFSLSREFWFQPIKCFDVRAELCGRRFPAADSKQKGGTASISDLFHLIFQRSSRRSTFRGSLWALWSRLAAKWNILIAVFLLPPESIYIHKDMEVCIPLSMILCH